MVAIGISEFTFGYAFLFDLTLANWGDITAAPILPSLQQENNLGWDASLPMQGIPYFYQFKLTEFDPAQAEVVRNDITDVVKVLRDLIVDDGDFEWGFQRPGHADG